MKMAEFLNLNTKQVQWLDASLEHPNLVKIPTDTEAITLLEDRYINFYKDGASFAIDLGERDWDYGAKGTVENYLTTYPDAKIIWQRNPLQEKINETLSVLNVNKSQLSILLGREKSYVKRLLAKDRNVTENTKVAVIDQLDQLIRMHEKESENSKCVKKLTVTLSVDTKEVQDELKKAYSLIDQANDNSTAWQKKYKDQKNLSLFLISVSITLASMVFWVLYCLWGVL